MQTGLTAGLTTADRKLLWGGGLIAVLLFAGTVAFAPSPAGVPASRDHSTYSAAPEGALAAYLMLVDLGYPVQRWEDPPALLNILNTPAAGSLLILADPTETPSKADRESLMRFVKNGGRILFCGPTVMLFFHDAGLSMQNLDPGLQEFSASLPSYVSRGADKIAVRPAAYWGDLSPSQIRLYGDSQSPVVIAWRVDAGEILWWAGPTPLTNEGIKRADNLSLFLNTVSGAKAGEPVSIYWDEYFHGQRSSLWSYIEKTPLVWGCLQLVLLTLGLLFTFSRRSGPIFAPATVSRLSQLEFVETMGGLYQRAGAAAIPVDVSYRRLRFLLTRQLGLASTTLNPDLAETARQRLGFDIRLRDVLQDAARSANLEKLSAKRALSLVRQLESYVLQLRTPKPLSKEKP